MPDLSSSTRIPLPSNIRRPTPSFAPGPEEDGPLANRHRGLSTGRTGQVTSSNSKKKPHDTRLPHLSKAKGRISHQPLSSIGEVDEVPRDMIVNAPDTPRIPIWLDEVPSRTPLSRDDRQSSPGSPSPYTEEGEIPWDMICHAGDTPTSTLMRAYSGYFDSVNESTSPPARQDSGHEASSWEVSSVAAMGDAAKTNGETESHKISRAGSKLSSCLPLGCFGFIRRRR